MLFACNTCLVVAAVNRLLYANSQLLLAWPYHTANSHGLGNTFDMSFYSSADSAISMQCKVLLTDLPKKYNGLKYSLQKCMKEAAVRYQQWCIRHRHVTSFTAHSIWKKR